MLENQPKPITMCWKKLDQTFANSIIIIFIKKKPLQVSIKIIFLTTYHGLLNNITIWC